MKRLLLRLLGRDVPLSDGDWLRFTTPLGSVQVRYSENDRLFAIIFPTEGNNVSISQHDNSAGIFVFKNERGRK